MVRYDLMTTEELLKVLERKDLEIQELRGALNCVAELIDNSDGVAGLHLNGELASWESLMVGGQFEEWLGDFERAINT